jgi:hypothetical protein
MSSEPATVTASRNYRPKPKPNITVAGEVWEPRANLANEVGICDRTAARYNWPTVYISGIAYCRREECLADLVARARRRHEPAKHRRARGG